MSVIRPHVVLLGDSIFDNGVYVPGEPPVIDQLRAALPAQWRASLCAVDGDTTCDVAAQLRRIPIDTTHLVVSVGGNDALGLRYVVGQDDNSLQAKELDRAYENFRQLYSAMLSDVIATGNAIAVCTIYDAVPGLGVAERLALAGFNEVILRQAFIARLPVVDLRLVCETAADFSSISPIEPSAAGGVKISKAIVEMLIEHQFNEKRSSIYC